jgi:serine/threonine protein phosphatase 1
MTATTYAIGDIHGRLDLLSQLLDLIEADATARSTPAKIVFTGDFVDRGADSFGVVERLIAGPRRAADRFICLRGNHDDLFVRAVTEDDGVPDWAWILFGYTIASYGADPRNWKDSAELRRHAEFLASLALTHDDGDHLFVHAGIRPGTALEDQLEHDLLWIRDPFLSHDDPLPRRIVHGHTIMGDRPVIRQNRISIDTGAYRSGILTAAVISQGETGFLQAVGDIDRAAVVREELLSATVQKREVPEEAQRAFDAFLALDIDLAEMTRRAAAA